MYSSYSVVSITVTASVAPSPSNHFPPFTAIHSIMCKSFISLSTTSFYIFWAYLCLAPSTSTVTQFFTQSSLSFLKTCLYHCSLFLWTTFTWPLLLFLTAALTQCKIIYPLISHHTFILSFSFLPDATSFRFLFAMTTSHFRVTYKSVHMHHKPFLATAVIHLISVIIRGQWPELKPPLRILAVTAASASPSTDNMSPR